MLVVGVAISANGTREYTLAHPSPHFYIELFYALPQIALGAVIALGAILSFSRLRWIRITGLAFSFTAIALAAVFYLVVAWAVTSSP